MHGVVLPSRAKKHGDRGVEKRPRCSLHSAEPAPCCGPHGKVSLRQLPLTSLCTCYFPLSNLTLRYFTVSQVWHSKHSKEKQTAETPRKIRIKALTVFAGQWGGGGARASALHWHAGSPSLLPIPAVPWPAENNHGKVFLHPSWLKGRCSHPWNNSKWL